MKGAPLLMTVAGVAAQAVSPTRFPLSRYSTRTAPAVPGRLLTHLPQVSAATSLLWAVGEPLPGHGQEAVGGCAGSHAERPTGQDIGGRDRWHR
jgi:hypothetical protein